MKTPTAALAIALMCLSPAAFAGHDPDAAQMGHARIDTNGDGWISQEEFMAHQQIVWNELPKNSDGLVSTKNMPTHRDKMIRESGVTMEGDTTPSERAKQEKVKTTEAQRP